MKKYFMLIISFMVFSCVIFGNNNERRIRILFADFFINDTVTVYINNCKIVSDYVLNSDFSVGITKLNFDGRQRNKKVFIKFKGKEYKFNVPKDTILLTVVLNGKNIKSIIDLSKGGFVDLSKKENNELDIIQSENPFQYD